MKLRSVLLFVCTLCLLLSSAIGMAQGKFTISGTVKDSVNGESWDIEVAVWAGDRALGEAGGSVCGKCGGKEG